MKNYFILINSGMAYDYQYETIRGEKKTAHMLGAVISRHRTMKAALRARDEVMARKTDIVRLHFWPSADEFISEVYGAPDQLQYHPCSCLISQ